jgi:hypothetical protein|tara:strand:- start:183 stop:326 length:144 start_codon:yes stop_codon:yes gene_type:complete
MTISFWAAIQRGLGVPKEKCNGSSVHSLISSMIVFGRGNFILEPLNL